MHVSVGEPQQTIGGLRSGGELDVALVYQVGQSGLAWPHSMNRQWIGDDNFRVVLPKAWGIRAGSVMEASPTLRHAVDHAPPGNQRCRSD